MSNTYFFGYGSLVNRATHDFAPVHPARASGWRRAWRFTAARQVSFLTVLRDPDCTIDGLIAAVPAADWTALDLREHAYDRLSATADVDHPAGAGADVAIYAIPSAQLNLPDDSHPVLLSYIDVVIQGFLREFGPEGAARFFSTTTGWEAPVLDDRNAPRYPRAQVLTDTERAVVDRGLAALGCRVIA